MKFSKLFLMSVLLISVSGQVIASDWDVKVGAGAMYKPEFEGSDDYEVDPLPYIDVTYMDRYYLNVRDGLGAHILKGDGLNIKGGIGVDFGREDSDGSGIRGLGDIDASATLNASASYNMGAISPFIDLKQHLSETEGTQIDLGVKGRAPVKEFFPQGTMIMSSLSTQYASDDYMDGFFGVNARQSARSGLSQFNAEGGFKSIDTGASLIIPVTENVMVNTMVGYSMLIGDAGDSPVSQDDNQFSTGAFLVYRF